MRRRIVAVAGVVGVGLVVFVLVWFQPQKLFIDQTVNERAPTAAPHVRVIGGSFRSLAHEGSGTVTYSSGYLRFEDFRVENGPDLFVYLSAAAVGSPQAEYATDFVDLGRLKGNIGNQNYDVPVDTDLTKYRTVVIWCRRFSTAFAAAQLT